jgi:hypothetical protein
MLLLVSMRCHFHGCSRGIGYGIWCLFCSSGYIPFLITMLANLRCTQSRLLFDHGRPGGWICNEFEFGCPERPPPSRHRLLCGTSRPAAEMPVRRKLGGRVWRGREDSGGLPRVGVFCVFGCCCWDFGQTLRARGKWATSRATEGTSLTG